MIGPGPTFRIFYSRLPGTSSRMMLIAGTCNSSAWADQFVGAYRNVKGGLTDIRKVNKNAIVTIVSKFSEKKFPNS